MKPRTLIKKQWRAALKDPFTVVLVGYFALVSLLRWRLDVSLVIFWLGGLIGLLMDYVDRLVYVYYVKPAEPLSLAIKRLVNKRQWQLVYIAFQHRGKEQTHLALHSVLFLLVWLVIAFYLITSSGSILTAGLVLSLGLQLAYQMAMDYKQPNKLRAWLFWQIKRTVTETEMKVVVWAYWIAFGLMTWLMV
ncbi:hypothetical protein A2W24_05415 [Microgenomates group bacterium RBG_16_45_19]|nr:MAG: hypothetical protein A2W24_05415 [Microgenomates group bacterium RBG_16_45_19]